MLGLLGDITWHGEPVPGRRTQALLAALAAGRGRPVGDQALVAAVWADDESPANPGKALQVVVSRARSATGADVVARSAGGYRLALATADVDVLALDEQARAAVAAEGRGDLVAARDAARAVQALPVPSDAGDGAVGELRVRAAEQRRTAAGVLGRALSGLAQHDEALPLLEQVGPVDEPSSVALLRSLAAVQGASVALDRYEALRTALADRLGVDPGPQLRAVHAELLAADHPVRSGLRFDAASLVGRDEDLRALRGLVRQSRVVSILGPGGLGKTRLANLLAAEAEQAVVHVVELVGVSAAEDVVGEIGSALGVRDSLAGRRVLTPEQRRDVRARIARSLEQAPALLVLDNCEHVVEAVADLVAYLVATVRHLRVVTTTRAPLAIAAERVFALGQLAEDDAVRLFAERARSARPAVALDTGPDGAVRRVVRRLDGLPLAIELAAARVRAMSVEDVGRRLDDRFALLRGGDRSAPDRHQTLLAVIDWSWNLLTEHQRRALRWLSTYHDGFTLTAAEALLAERTDRGDVLDGLQALVDQSLLTLVESEGGVRYRMLETVREFGRMQLVGAGEDVAARAARQAWARELSAARVAGIWGAGQVAAVRALNAEETNLADCLRTALAEPDPGTVAVIMAALGWTWTIRGENLRVLGLVGAVDDSLAGWEPGQAEVDHALLAVSVVLLNSHFGGAVRLRGCRRLLHACRTRAADGRVRAVADVVDAQIRDDGTQALDRLTALAEATTAADDGPVDLVGREILARTWVAHERENDGDPRAAVVEGGRALALLPRHDDPWLATLVHVSLAAHHAQLGHHRLAAEQARAALPGLEALGADDDLAQTRGLLVFDAIADGRLDQARAEIAVIETLDLDAAFFGGIRLAGLCRAELALADGDLAAALAGFRGTVLSAAQLSLPMITADAVTPWLLASEATAVVVFARFAEAGVGDDGHDLHASMLRRVPDLLDPGRDHVDYPISGLVLFALASWDLLRALPALAPGERTASGWTARTAASALALADLLAFPRTLPSGDPAAARAAAERLAPGVVEAVRAEYGHRRGPQLMDATRELIGLD